MATKLRYLIDEIIVDLKQTIDDAEISPVTVGFWIITQSNRILSQHVQKMDSGAFLTTWPSVPVIVPTATQTTGVVAGRKYITLPSSIFDFDKDGGIEYISYQSDGGPGCPPEFEFQKFERTSPSEARLLTWSPYTKPSPTRPYYYRTKDYIPLLGIESINVEYVEVGIYSTIECIDTIDIDAPFDFPEELMDVLRRSLLDLGRFILFMPSERTNVGDDPINEGSQIPTQKIASVNEQQIQ
jgi:hypothetical protein